MNDIKCAVPSCQQPRPRLYDDVMETHFCDLGCFTEYFVENPESFVDWYAGMNLHDVD